MSDSYTAPTLGDLKKVFEKGKVGKPIKVKPRECQDAQKFIAMLNKAYKATKDSSIHFG